MGDDDDDEAFRFVFLSRHAVLLACCEWQWLVASREHRRSSVGVGSVGVKEGDQMVHARAVLNSKLGGLSPRLCLHEPQVYRSPLLDRSSGFLLSVITPSLDRVGE